MSKPKRFKWTLQVDLDIAETWVADGFNPESFDLAAHIRDSILNWADESEKRVKVKILAKPLNADVKRAQGES